MTEATRTPIARLARWWWLLVSAMWIVGFSVLLNWTPGDEVVYRVPIAPSPLPDATAATLANDPQMPFLAGEDASSDNARRAEVRAQIAGEAHLGVARPDCWGDLYSAPDARGTEMQWRCETRASWARMIVVNLLVLASFPILLPLAITAALRIGRKIARNS